MIWWTKIFFLSMRATYLRYLRDRIVAQNPAHPDFLEVSAALYQVEWRLRQLWPDKW